MADREGAVAERRFRSGRDSSEATACVRSSSGIAERFDCSVVVDGDCSHILEFSCNCPAARKYGVMCKHAVATALTFRDDPCAFAGFEDSFVPKSSPSIIAYLEEEHAGERLAPGSVHLGVSLSYGFGAWRATFTISARGLTYVMSDIGAFIDALANVRYLSYGKMLGFVHTLEVFDTSSQAAALVLADVITALRTDRVVSRSVAADGGRTRAPKRMIDLSEQDVVRLIDAVHADGFEFVDEELKLEARSMHVVDEKPAIELRIIALDDGMFEIMRDDRFVLAMGIGTSYVLMDDVAYRCSFDYARAAAFLHDVYLSNDDDLRIAQEDIARFCRNALPMLESSLDVKIPSQLEAFRPREAKFSFYLDREGFGKNSGITCEVKVAYGLTEHILLQPNAKPDVSAGDAEGKSEYRDEDAEASVIDRLSAWFDASMRIPLENVELAGEFLFEGIPALQSLGSVFTTPDFDRLISDKSMRVQIGLSLAGNLINLDVKPTDISRDELAAVLAAYQRRRRFHKLKDGTILSLDNLELKHLDRMLADLGLKSSDIANPQIELPTYNAFILDREYTDAIRSKSFEEYLWRFDSNDNKIDPPESLAKTLRPYQVEGFRWLSKLASMGFGGILADEMGLGKTLQLISFLVSQKESGKMEEPALIVCPASLVYNWIEEFAKFAPSLSICAIDGPSVERMRKRQAKGVDVFVVSYDSVRQDSNAFERASFSVIALDEAQFIKNHATKTARAVKRLNACHRFALTGTPIENRLSEMWSIMDFLMPGFLGSYALFRRRYEIDILGGDDDVARRLQALVGPFVLRRLKSDVLCELPEKQEGVIKVALEGEQRRLYDVHEQKLREDLLAQRRLRKNSRQAESNGLKVDTLAELMRLRQTALDPSLVYENYRGGSAKTAAILELIDQARDAGKKVLVFSQFTSYLDTLKPLLSRDGIAYYEITGKTGKKDRVDMANAFNENDVPVFLVSLKAGGTGLNLIGASIVIHADPWWNAAATNQATDRAHRIGQKDMVSVYKVIAKDTIEERIVALQDAKSQLADSVVTETSLGTLSSLTRSELESLLFDD